MEESNNFADAGMLIRKPIEEVFNAFIDPEITTKFWFTDSSGKIVENEQITWSWKMYGVSVEVNVVKVVENKLIEIVWGNKEQESKVEWQFREHEPNNTFVTIVNSGFKGTVDDKVKMIRDSTGGFSWVLSGLKAYLEFGIQLNLIADRHP